MILSEFTVPFLRRSVHTMLTRDSWFDALQAPLISRISNEQIFDIHLLSHEICHLGHPQLFLKYAF